MKFKVLLLAVGLVGLGIGVTTLVGRAATAAESAQTTYWANGKLQIRTEYHDGHAEGRSERWYADGTKMAEGRFENGEMEGQWNFWNADGSVDAGRSGIYRQGVKSTGG